MPPAMWKVRLMLEASKYCACTNLHYDKMDLHDSTVSLCMATFVHVFVQVKWQPCTAKTHRKKHQKARCTVDSHVDAFTPADSKWTQHTTYIQ